MSKFLRFCMFSGVIAMTLPGCGGGDTTPQATGKSELEQYMVDHPELANETMPDLDE